MLCAFRWRSSCDKHKCREEAIVGRGGEATTESWSLHLLSQPDELEHRTYQKLVLESYKGKMAVCLATVLPPNACEPRSVRTHGGRIVAQQKRGVGDTRAPAVTASSALKQYMRVQWMPGLRPLTAAAQAERTRLVAGFRALDNDRKRGTLPGDGRRAHAETTRAGSSAPRRSTTS